MDMTWGEQGRTPKGETASCFNWEDISSYGKKRNMRTSILRLIDPNGDRQLKILGKNQREGNRMR